jgi:transcriptional antiterminator RfaH
MGEACLLDLVALAGSSYVEPRECFQPWELQRAAAGRSSSIPPWFALRVRSRSEASVAEALWHRRFEVFAPTWFDRRVVSIDTRRGLARPAFPGYLFARFDPSKDKSMILSTPGVASILATGGVLTPVPDVEIEAVRLALAAGAQPAPEAQPASELHPGQRVRVLTGALKGVEGELVSAHGSFLHVTITLLQRAVALKIAPEAVEAI